MAVEVKPSKDLSKLCKYWVSFLKEKHERYGIWNKKELSIGDSTTCMVAEAWKWTAEYHGLCPDCTNFGLALDGISEKNRGKNITPIQVNRMFRKGNTFATHYMKKHYAK